MIRVSAKSQARKAGQLAKLRETGICHLSVVQLQFPEVLVKCTTWATPASVTRVPASLKSFRLVSPFRWASPTSEICVRTKVQLFDARQSPNRLQAGITDLTVAQVHPIHPLKRQRHPSTTGPPTQPRGPIRDAIDGSASTLNLRNRRLVAINSHAEPGGANDAENCEDRQVHP